MLDEQQQFQVTSDQQAELAALLEATGKPWPKVLDEALTTYRQEEVRKRNGGSSPESFFEAASRLRLIGCLRGGPSDLSTNPSYMEGFGRSDG